MSQYLLNKPVFTHAKHPEPFGCAQDKQSKDAHVAEVETST